MEAPGPGHYNAEKGELYQLNKEKATSVFISNVARDAYQMGKKGQTSKFNKAYSQSANYAGAGEDIFEDDEDEDTPGPCSYFQPHQSTTFKVR